MELDNEFLVSDSDWKWLLAHTDYREAELNDLLQGFFLTMSTNLKNAQLPCVLLSQDSERSILVVGSTGISLNNGRATLWWTSSSGSFPIYGLVEIFYVFSILDTDSNGYLDFKEFHQALLLLSTKSTEQKLE